MLEKLYNNIYYLGLKSGYMLRNFFRWFGKKIRVPLKAVGSVLLAALLMVGRALRKTFVSLGSHLLVVENQKCQRYHQYNDDHIQNLDFTIRTRSLPRLNLCIV